MNIFKLARKFELKMSLAADKPLIDANPTESDEITGPNKERIEELLTQIVSLLSGTSVGAKSPLVEVLVTPVNQESERPLYVEGANNLKNSVTKMNRIIERFFEDGTGFKDFTYAQLNNHLENLKKELSAIYNSKATALNQFRKNYGWVYSWVLNNYTLNVTYGQSEHNVLREKQNFYGQYVTPLTDTFVRLSQLIEDIQKIILRQMNAGRLSLKDTRKIMKGTSQDLDLTTEIAPLGWQELDEIVAAGHLSIDSIPSDLRNNGKLLISLLLTRKDDEELRNNFADTNSLRLATQIKSAILNTPRRLPDDVFLNIINKHTQIPVKNLRAIFTPDILDKLCILGGSKKNRLSIFDIFSDEKHKEKFKQIKQNAKGANLSVEDLSDKIQSNQREIEADLNDAGKKVKSGFNKKLSEDLQKKCAELSQRMQKAYAKMSQENLQTQEKISGPKKFRKFEDPDQPLPGARPEPRSPGSSLFDETIGQDPKLSNDPIVLVPPRRKIDERLLPAATPADIIMEGSPAEQILSPVSEVSIEPSSETTPTAAKLIEEKTPAEEIMTSTPAEEIMAPAPKEMTKEEYQFQLSQLSKEDQNTFREALIDDPSIREQIMRGEKSFTDFI